MSLSTVSGCREQRECEGALTGSWGLVQVAVGVGGLLCLSDISFCLLFSNILIISVKTWFFLFRSLASASLSSKLTFTILSSLFKKSFSTSFGSFNALEAGFLALPGWRGGGGGGGGGVGGSGSFWRDGVNSGTLGFKVLVRADELLSDCEEDPDATVGDVTIVPVAAVACSDKSKGGGGSG